MCRFSCLFSRQYLFVKKEDNIMDQKNEKYLALIKIRNEA